MRFDLQSVREAQRQAYKTLSDPQDAAGNKNPLYTPAAQITMSAQLIQEQAFVNTAQSFTFDFSLNGPTKTPILNNVVLGKNNVFVAYAFQLLIGEGANGNNRIYRSRGLTPNDDSIYNSNTILKLESNTVVDKMNGQGYRDIGTNANEFWAEAGLQLINPQRILTGELGTFQTTIELYNSISALALTPNLFLSFRLIGCLGQAVGVNTGRK
jgi:hypothetical protein